MRKMILSFKFGIWWEKWWWWWRLCPVLFNMRSKSPHRWGGHRTSRISQSHAAHQEDSRLGQIWKWRMISSLMEQTARHGKMIKETKMTKVSPLLIPFEKIEMMMMLNRRMSPPGHSESFAGPIGGHPHPYESHSTWSNHLAPHHSGSAEICQIFRRRTANILLG